MATQKLTVSGETVEYAIRKGLEKIALPQEKILVKILQHDTQSIFGSKEALVSIVYDKAESDAALKSKNDAEFKSKFKFQYQDGHAEVLVPSCFFDERYLEDVDARIAFMVTYLEENGITDPDEELVNKLATNVESEYKYCPVKQIESIRINEDKASIHLKISEDKMLCEALIFHGKGCTEEEVYEVLKQNQVIYGIFKKNLANAIKYKYSDYFEISKGLEPVDDSPGSLDKFFQESEHKEFAKMMEKLTIDTRQIKDINIAERHQLLMNIGEIIEGTNGYRIDGSMVKKQDVTNSDASIKIGKNVYYSDDGKSLYSKAPGHIIWNDEKNFIDVEPIYIVDGNVDFSEGNIIDFVGKVLIRGDVKSKFTVSAEGDIEIQGSVEDANVKSINGNVFIAGSIVHKMEGCVEAKDTVHCMIATNASIKADKVIIEKEAMNCQITADTEIHVLGTPGVILGGEIYAKQLVSANSIGSSNWTPTKIHVGDVTELKQQLRVFRQKSSNLGDRLKEAKEIVTLLEQHQERAELSRIQKKQLMKAERQIPELEETLSFSQEQEEHIKEEIKIQRTARLEIHKDLFPQVDIFIFEGHMVPQKIETYTGFRYREGRIQRFSI
jgi:uncharacterized protein (DUF342 family)